MNLLNEVTGWLITLQRQLLLQMIQTAAASIILLQWVTPWIQMGSHPNIGFVLNVFLKSILTLKMTLILIVDC